MAQNSEAPPPRQGIENCWEFSLNNLGDARGSLVSIEQGRTVPFDIKRVYYIYGTAPHTARGGHAHKRLQQVLIAVSGQCKIRNFDGKTQESVLLDSPQKALFIGKEVWHEMDDFSSDCVLLVLADDFYDESEYIRDYNQFIAVISK